MSRLAHRLSRDANTDAPVHNRAPTHTHTRNNDALALIYYKHELVTRSPATYRRLSSYLLYNKCTERLRVLLNCSANNFYRARENILRYRFIDILNVASGIFPFLYYLIISNFRFKWWMLLRFSYIMCSPRERFRSFRGGFQRDTLRNTRRDFKSTNGAKCA